MKRTVKLYPPKAGLTGITVDCWVGTWFVKENDYIFKEDIICELETDKATLEFESEFEGRIKNLKKVEEVFQNHQFFAEVETSLEPTKEEKEKHEYVTCKIDVKREDFNKIKRLTDSTVEHWIGKKLSELLNDKEKEL